MALSATKPIIVFALLWSTAHAAPSRYLCTDLQSVGLHYEKADRTWTPHAFVNATYILRKLTLADQDSKTQRYAPVLSAYPEATWAFLESQPVDPQPVAVCREDEKLGFICQPISVEAQFEVASRRFQIIRNQGYMAQAISQQLRRENPKGYAELAKGGAGDPDHPDDLVIEIGTCGPS